MSDRLAFTPVQSKLLSGITYDEASETLHVRFAKSGAIYRYAKVDPDTFDQLMRADSIGSHFLKTIKDAHEFTRVEQDT